ncbi:hypothetical protein M885DRAFT_140922 [Pelagophyceae sp. CCMP2097]|nr:hypothetical protein M885DRAFT_140922 [Pelagophyceae sp. CCMP2097]
MGDAGAAAREAFLAGDAALALRALSGGDPDAAHHSNLGVASAALDLPAAALRHFATALVSEDFEGDSQQKSAIHYNAGLALLASGNFRAAFEHLGCAAQAHGAEPRLWLRLAECCARVRQNLVNESATRRSVVGARPKLEDSGPMSLQRASVYARHALRLVSAVRVSDDADDVSATARLQLAWIHLELADYSIALEWADCALSGAASPEQRDLARLYASDARMHLGYNDVERCVRTYQVRPPKVQRGRFANPQVWSRDSIVSKKGGLVSRTLSDHETVFDSPMGPCHEDLCQRVLVSRTLS